MISVLCGSLLVLSASRGADAEDAWPVLEGPYLGQSPPGMTPEIFAAGVISSEDEYELNSVFSLDGNEFYYAISTTSAEEKEQGQYFYLVMVTRRVGGIWTKPSSTIASQRTEEASLSPRSGAHMLRMRAFLNGALGSKNVSPCAGNWTFRICT